MTAVHGWWRAGVYCLCLLAAWTSSANPDIHHWTTDKGARAYFVAAPEIPIIDVRVVFNAGAARDGEQAGIARLVSALLRDGAGDLDANAFNDRLADTGAVLSSGALRDMAWASLRTLSDPQYAEPALQLLRDMLSQPRFDDDAVERARANALVKIKHDQQSPGAMANLTFFAQLYGAHPYASPITGTAASVAAISRARIEAFHRRYYVAKNATIALVGAISKAQAQQIVADISAALASGQAAAPLAPVPALETARDQHVDFPSIQSHIRMGQPGLKRGDPDYFPLLVGNHVLGGGGLVSILFDEVREKRGLSYSVNSYFSPMAELGPFTASLQTDNSQQDEALTVLRAEIRKFVANGPSEAALEAAKQNLVGGFPLRISSNAKTIEYLAMIGFYNLPLDYLQTFQQHVAAVTVADVKAAFQRRLDPQKMVTVIVGQANAKTANSKK